MKIGLYAVEPKYTNLALEKVKAYYLSHKNTVAYCTPMEASQFDIVYCSSIFQFSNKKYVLPSMIKGGTGFYVWDESTKKYFIPDGVLNKLPADIDAVEPHINSGFTTIGCPNACSFCVVNLKEGVFKIIGDVETLWDGKSKEVTCYDNNILHSPEHFEHNAKIAHNRKIVLDYNQGLDHRKLTPDIVDLMKYFPHKEYHFAFDSPNYIDTVKYAIDLLQSKGIMRCTWYVLCGFNTTMAEDLFRLNYLRSRNQNAYVQRFKSAKNNKDIRLITLARWVNQHAMFQGMTWEQFLDHPDNVRYKKLILSMQ